MGRWGTLKDTVLLVTTLPYYVLGPYVDNWLRILTRRDLRRFLQFDLGGRALRQVVESRLSGCEWSVRHEGYIWASVVECWANGEGLFRWEVSHQPPVPWLEPGLFVTPLNRASAALVPELLPPGLDIRQLPRDRYASGVIYQLADPEKSRAWLGPWVERLKIRELGEPDK